MVSAPFPREVQAFAAIEKSLDADLSLQDIEKIGEQVVNVKTSDQRTRDIGIGLLNRLETKREQVVKDQLAKLDQTRDPVAKIKQLQPLMEHIAPEEVERQFSAIAMEASLLSGDNQKTQKAVQGQLLNLRITFAKPIFRALDADAPQSFANEALKVRDAVLRTKSTAPLKAGFNDVQLQEVYRAAARGA